MSYDMKVERLIDASPEEVFDAYTNPEAQRVWFTIFNQDMIVENVVDLRVGGTWVSTWGVTPDEMYRETNVFEVVDRPHRLVSRSSFTSPDGSTVETTVEITFRTDGGKTAHDSHPKRLRRRGIAGLRRQHGLERRLRPAQRLLRSKGQLGALSVCRRSAGFGIG
jgi:uncharacterized protein YndB with AHSA1/START domain